MEGQNVGAQAWAPLAPRAARSSRLTPESPWDSLGAESGPSNDLEYMRPSQAGVLTNLRGASLKSEHPFQPYLRNCNPLSLALFLQRILTWQKGVWNMSKIKTGSQMPCESCPRHTNRCYPS